MRPGRQLLDLLRRREERRAPLLSSVAADVLDVVPLPARTGTAAALVRRLEPVRLHGPVDPNAKRTSPLQRVETGTVRSRRKLADASKCCRRRPPGGATAKSA